ncbi:lysophospholipid acyltransferase family protein [Hyphococcus luteus]|uniref:1-acyl-sn-glycerol-3-phosphate acyltransferase n=1 Tax=Hyphococcus luteus TaxID=2058213 RepID=A0A2S7KAU0_9PROT|nr:lysophospholipid acyltransferase family protein [Marinicaulis flavus]PQA89622.1 1-acyl-sn-glycerol-3-phosphate acyltransferase [Marinicaulis flavus]
MKRVLQFLFFLFIVRPVLLVILGMNVRGREHLPEKGPAVLVANHNSHLDTLTLMALFPLKDLHRLRPAAAADYFLANRWLKWFALNIINIIPLARGGVRKNPLADLEAALDRNEILILFPEGSRGEPEQRAEFKRGVAYLAKARPDVPIYPVFMHGLGKALPRGSFILVPFNCDVFAGAAIKWTGDPQSFMGELELQMTELAEQGRFQPWE